MEEDKVQFEIIYMIDDEVDKECDILGESFMKDNKQKIDIIIDKEVIDLTEKYKMNKGKNTVTIQFKVNLTNLKSMFEGCQYLYEISSIKNLKKEIVTNLASMFSNCTKLTNIKGLEDLNVSKVTDFSKMFSECSQLKDLEPLREWDVSNGTNFSYMFSNCKNLTDINA